MEKKLSDMTLEELWQLFPIILTEHQEEWAQWYGEEAAALGRLLPGCMLSHIGSTSIPGMWAKPIVDILVEVPEGVGLTEVKGPLAAGGWTCMSEGGERLSFNKGYTPQGFAERVFHLHVRRQGDRDEVLFRDYLLAHPETAKRYEELKLSLWKLYEHDRDGYTDAKGAFVRQVMEAATAQGGASN